MDNDVETGAHNHFAVEVLSTACHVDDVQFRDRVDSTSDWAIRSAPSIQAGSVVLYLAQQQTAGRGRGDNRWFAGTGSLTFSLLTDLSFEINDVRRSLLPLAVGCGICDAVTRYVPEVAIKWPNDIYLKDAKLGGVLVESVFEGARQVIGCGLNVNNDVGQISQAISLGSVIERAIPLNGLVIEIVNAVLARLRSVGSGSWEAVVEDVRARDWLRGRLVKWTSGRVRKTGKATGISDDGGLWLETSDGPEKVYSGSIQPLKN